MLAAVGRVTDQPLIAGVHDEIQQLQGDLADEVRVPVLDFHDIRDCPVRSRRSLACGVGGGELRRLKTCGYGPDTTNRTVNESLVTSTVCSGLAVRPEHF